MRYGKVTEGRFLIRLNRFAARVETPGGEETVHVKNTGRLGELLFPGATVYLTRGAGEGRKTEYDLVAAESRSGAIFNIDSLAPNRAMKEFLEGKGYDRIVPEYRFGDSRLDFYMEKERERFLTEVKGCTLIREGVGYFPDAPTGRGTKHLRELARAAGEGFSASVAFVIQTEGVFEVRPNEKTDPAFARAWREAEAAGVAVRMHPTRVTPEELTVLA